MTEVKRAHDFFSPDGSLRELKYTNCRDQGSFEVAREVLDAFFDSASWFRCIAIEQSKIDLSRFGKPDEPKKIKKARLYKRFAELLIANNTERVQDGVLLTDGMTRCSEDQFIEWMKDEFAMPGNGYSAGKSSPTLRHIDDIDSSVDSYQVIQVCDLMLGCILNSLFPAANEWKNRLREHLVERLGVNSLRSEDWMHYSKRYVEETHPKFNVWYWRSNP
jgi:hypothetical protein